MILRRSIVPCDALDFHLARPPPSRGDRLDFRLRHPHYRGWSIREPHHAEYLRGLLPKCFLGASRPRALRQKQDRIQQAAVGARRELATKRRHCQFTLFSQTRRPAGNRHGRFRPATCFVPASQDVPAESLPFFRYRLVDRPHALPVLVEHLVWTPAPRQTNQRIPQGRKASAPNPACPRPTRRAHGTPQRRRGALVSRNDPAVFVSHRGSAQYRCLGYGPGYFRPGLSRDAPENAPGSIL